MIKNPFLTVLLAVMLVAVAAMLVMPLTGCSVFSSSGSGTDITAKLKTVNKTIANAVIVAYQSGGNQLAYQKVDKMVTDGKITPDQAAAIKASLDKGIVALQEAANSPDTATPAATAPPAATSTAAAPVSTGP